MIQGAVINYIKLHLPFTMLCAYAEDLHFSVPLQVRIDQITESQKVNKHCSYTFLCVANHVVYF